MMENLQMVDLKGQYQEIKAEVDAAIQSVIDNTSFINGPEVKKLASELETYLGVKHVIPCGNGTDALQIALMALGLEPGDEVLCPDFTFVASAEVAGVLQIKTVLVDVHDDCFTIDLDAAEKALTNKTKAIIPVHLFGQCANMDAVLEFAKKHNLFVVEDTAQAIGADYISKSGVKHKAGTMGEMGTTSFFPSKNLGCYGDGGAIFTNDDELARITRQIVNHGMGAQYDYERVGVNSRLDSIQAVILSAKLKRLDQYSAARQKAAAFYDQAFADVDAIETPYRRTDSTHVFHQYTLKLKEGNRNELQSFLESKGVPCKVYYPMPLHSFSAYHDANRDEEEFKVTNKLCKSVFSLPMHTELSEEQLTFITNTVKSFLKA